MTMLFEPLDLDGHKRSAARLSILQCRVLTRFDRVEEAADKVQAAAELFAEATRPVGSTQTLGM
ncbi:hypothetical protein [Mesorhizobium sp. M0619]|uniref:hypothetical protein n=1 Tax=unclassified Mesorhizobium TaxID=325217 RepID=UPI003335B2E7